MSAKLSSTFRDNVRRRMAILGYTQTTLATRLGCTQSYVSQILTGHRDPGLDTLEAFAEALETSAAKLLDEKKLSKAS